MSGLCVADESFRITYNHIAGGAGGLNRVDCGQLLQFHLVA